ncbi:MAG: DUF4965 domain-containing protein [Clostridia bacterium]|nr:DUF4965 domain-containing protein [Clostridia bacterium]
MEYKSYLPAYPLISIDPFLSIWSPSDHPADSDTAHWAGERKRMTLSARIDGKTYALIGSQLTEKAALTGRCVTPSKTVYTFKAGETEIAVSFRAPLLMDDLDLLSTPVNYMDIETKSLSGQEKEVFLSFVWHDDILKDGASATDSVIGSEYDAGGFSLAWMGKQIQPVLNRSGDRITIDWGYAYLASEAPVCFDRVAGHWALVCQKAVKTGENLMIAIAYDDIASIQYFEYTAHAYYARNGKTIVQAIREMMQRHDEIVERLNALDADLLEKAEEAGGESMKALAAASYRHSVCAHKLIADRDGNPVFLSKENDSNGCIGTVDVSYPSTPLYLMYCPELVRGMCRPIFRFASLPVWKDDFAPHDVGRYPIATGQVYALSGRRGREKAGGWNDEKCDPVFYPSGQFPPVFLYEGPDNIYEHRYQMPVEECGNMILMVAAAMRADGDTAFAKENLPMLKKWVRYLETYGEDPGEQLCTDDFAGHLAHNVNLAFKAVCGLAAYGWMMEKLGEADEAEYYRNAAVKMGRSVYERAKTDNGTALTLNGEGWSLKYNTVWDKLFGFGIWDDAFYKAEIARYMQETNAYGIPLDSRKTYTKSDWIMWSAAMADTREGVEAFAKPLVKYLKETPSRVAFSDWYDTVTGAYIHFIARSVQGGIFMPMLKKHWEKN